MPTSEVSSSSPLFQDLMFHPERVANFVEHRSNLVTKLVDNHPSQFLPSWCRFALCGWYHVVRNGAKATQMLGGHAQRPPAHPVRPQKRRFPFTVVTHTIAGWALRVVTKLCVLRCCPWCACRQRHANSTTHHAQHFACAPRGAAWGQARFGLAVMRRPKTVWIAISDVHVLDPSI